MSAYEIKVSVTPLCPCCGKECKSGLTESRKPEGVFDRDNPWERTDRRVFIGPCSECFVFRGDVAELIKAADAALVALGKYAVKIDGEWGDCLELEELLANGEESEYAALRDALNHARGEK